MLRWSLKSVTLLRETEAKLTPSDLPMQQEKMVSASLNVGARS